jgi:purine-binding chemotaxis protein CheW
MRSNNQNSKTSLPTAHREFFSEENLTAADLAQVWARRAYQLAEAPPAPVTGETVDLLVFWLGKERFGLEVSNVREIFPVQQLTPVPRTPNFVAGVFSARGRIISVIDLRAFLGLSGPAGNGSNKPGMSQAKIIVTTNTDLTSATAQMEVGLLVEEVSDVITIFKKDIEPPLISHTGPHSDYLRGITAEMLVVLNLNALLNDKRVIVLEELM